jgi:tetratricopeptide (TPR) repeat protein
MAKAAYNLCVILSKDRLDEALGFCRQAVNISPQEPRYSYTLAFYQIQKGESGEAINTLESLLNRQPAYADSYLLLGDIYQRQGKKEAAEGVYRRALASEGIADSVKARILLQMKALK